MDECIQIIKSDLGAKLGYGQLLTTSELGTQLFLRPETIFYLRKMRHLGDETLSQNVHS